MEISTITSDGKLTFDVVLFAFDTAIEKTGSSLPALLEACGGDQEKIEQVIFQRDQLLSAYFTILGLSLIQTGALFENVVTSLEKESRNLDRNIADMTQVDDQIKLLTSITGLATSSVMAFA